MWKSSSLNNLNKDNTNQMDRTIHEIDLRVKDNIDSDKSIMLENKQDKPNQVKYIDRKLKYYSVKKSKQILNINEKNKLIARGSLKGIFDIPISIEEEQEFTGCFKGAFQKIQNNGAEDIYFSGKITNLKLTQHQTIIKKLMINQLKQEVALSFQGYFKGRFYINHSSTIKNKSSLDRKQKKYAIQQLKNLEDYLIVQQSKKTNYYIPAYVRFSIERISEINLTQSSAQIYGTIKIDVQLSDEVADLLDSKWNVPNSNNKEWQERHPQLQKVKYKLALEFNRDRLIPLPFYDVTNQSFPKTDDQSEYEWDDLWSGISIESHWDKQKKRVSYSISTLWNSQIDNSYGIFYTPFNLNILKIVINFHPISIDKNNIINFVCCDLQDYQSNQQIGQYSPYTPFNNLSFKNEKNLDDICLKQIDRLTKINITEASSVGQFSIADNKMFLFPFYKNSLINKNKLGDDYRWSLGLMKREQLIKYPVVLTVQHEYNKAAKKIKTETPLKPFKFQYEWQYLYIQVPLFKYPVIDLIRIFIPILILNVISLFIFEQQNGTSGGITKISTRIASACSLLIAYTAMVPTIRQNFPPTPSVTLIEILIYSSTIPNFLAIISAFVFWSKDYQQFFADYRAFVDPIFLISFILCCVSLTILTILITVYSNKEYRANFKISKFQPSPMSHIRNPAFMKYMEQVSLKRKEFQIKSTKIHFYNKNDKYEQQQNDTSKVEQQQQPRKNQYI